MTFKDFAYNDYDTKNALRKQGVETGNKSVLRVYQTGKGVDPLHVEGQNKVGRVISAPDFSKDRTNEDYMGGTPGGHNFTIPISSSRTLQFTLDSLRLVGKWLERASVIDLDINYASDGQTTISSASKVGGTVADDTGVAIGDMFIVDTRHATYGGFLEGVIITSKSSTVVGWEPSLDHVPADTTTFKKVGGTGSGTDKTDTGIITVDAVDTEYPRIGLVYEEYFHSTKGRTVYDFPDVEVINGTANNSGNLKTRTLEFKPIQQAAASFTKYDGTTESLPWYGRIFHIPYES